MNGLVIALDGPDGVGKTTQLNLLAEYLKRTGQKVYSTRASGGTPIGEKLREASLSDHPRHPETDVYISLAMHTELGYDLQKRKVNNEVILVDRSPLAIVAYNGYGSQLNNIEDSLDATRKMLALWTIDVLILLEAIQDTLTERLQNRYKSDASSLNYFEKQGSSFFERVHEGYRAAVKLVQPPTKLINIDASGSVDDIHEAIISSLKLDITT